MGLNTGLCDEKQNCKEQHHDFIKAGVIMQGHLCVARFVALFQVNANKKRSPGLVLGLRRFPG
jgi:hypothetical protein